MCWCLIIDATARILSCSSRNAQRIAKTIKPRNCEGFIVFKIMHRKKCKSLTGFINSAQPGAGGTTAHEFGHIFGYQIM
ncbi:hypothetical protein GCM10011518_38920 [Flavobacterium limi]|uniref:Uncharacterized protein n=1 Tax=Flavobacterium limi TaxID=2045105 RepID=A0ABQ1UTU2_9FLAO|nr:hypothetical protein GCM10011518_38920 [Flavobacterium limi]